MREIVTDCFVTWVKVKCLAPDYRVLHVVRDES